MEIWNTASQLSLFLLAGTFNTTIDFVTYNLLTREPLRLSRIQANCISTTLAMTVSFTTNLLLVFHPTRMQALERGVNFILVTAFSSYVLQNAVIYVTSSVWLLPVRAALWSLRKLPVAGGWSDEFVQKNVVKALAVLAGLMWNFTWYKFFVFSN
jgi:putative flippase GtrA